jgi:ribosomal protein L35
LFACDRIKRWKQGFRHRRMRKSKEQKQRLSKPSVVFKAYAKVMKKLGAFKAI